MIERYNIKILVVLGKELERFNINIKLHTIFQVHFIWKISHFNVGIMINIKQYFISKQMSAIIGEWKLKRKKPKLINSIKYKST